MSGSTLAAKSSETLTMRVSLASGVPPSTAAPLISFEAYLDQVNTASGSTATLADTYATDIKVTSPPQSNTLQIVLIAIGAVVVVLAVIGVLLLWRRRRNQPSHAAHGTGTP
jgi:LPXTG-motif cell wall-anchored protein